MTTDADRPDAQILVRELVAAYVETELPDRRAELSAIFPALYRGVDDGGVGHGRSRDPLVAAVAVARAFVSSLLEKEVRGDQEWGDVNFDAVENRLEQSIHEPQLIFTLRRILETRLDRSRDLAGAAEARSAQRPSGVSPSVSGATPPHMSAVDRRLEEPAQTPPAEVEIAAPRVSLAAGGGTDLMILVDERRHDGRSFLSFDTVFPHPRRGIRSRIFNSEDFRHEPRDKLREFYADVETLARTRLEAETKITRFAGYSNRLTRELLPAGLIDALQEQIGLDASLLVLSREPWIPWELLHLGNDSDGRPLFLGEHFSITRWRSADGLECVTELPLQRIGVISPCDSALACAEAERTFLHSLADCGVAVEDIPARLGEIRRSMGDERFQGWHFIGHGSAPTGRSTDWHFQLESGVDLVPADLADVTLPAHPLVFLNACAVGRAEFALTRIDGLAEQFLAQGAGAVIAPLWAVHDECAFAFAKSVYHDLLAGSTLGEAARNARIKVRARRPSDPSPLAYAVHGNPNARCCNLAARSAARRITGEVGPVETRKTGLHG